MEEIISKNMFKFFSRRYNGGKERWEQNPNTTYPQKYRCNKYRAYMFIVSYDATYSEVRSKNDDPIVKLLMICRHMHTNRAICVQTVHDRIKEFKILISDTFHIDIFIMLISRIKLIMLLQVLIVIKDCFSIRA
jgi:hypothetical protein